MKTRPAPIASDKASNFQPLSSSLLIWGSTGSLVFDCKHEHRTVDRSSRGSFLASPSQQGPLLRQILFRSFADNPRQRDFPLFRDLPQGRVELGRLIVARTEGALLSDFGLFALAFLLFIAGSPNVTNTVILPSPHFTTAVNMNQAKHGLRGGGKGFICLVLVERYREAICHHRILMPSARVRWGHVLGPPQRPLAAAVRTTVQRANPSSQRDWRADAICLSAAFNGRIREA
jgi:hypothetical protein